MLIVDFDDFSRDARTVFLFKIVIFQHLRILLFCSKRLFPTAVALSSILSVHIFFTYKFKGTRVFFFEPIMEYHSFTRYEIAPLQNYALMNFPAISLKHNYSNITLISNYIQ